MWRLAIGLTFCVVEAAAGIYRCPAEDGVPLYTDRPCAGGVPQAPIATSVVETVPLTEHEAATLERLKRPSRAPRARAERPAVAAGAACATARAGLADIRETRRRGYRLRDAAAIDRRESELRALAAKACAN